MTTTPAAPTKSRSRMRPDIDTRFDVHGPIRWLYAAEGYVWVRRPSGNPFTMHRPDWERLTDVEDNAEAAGLMVKWGAVEHSPRRRHTDEPAAPPTNEVSYTAPAVPYVPWEAEPAR